MMVVISLLAILSFPQAGSLPKDVGSQIVKAGTLSRKAAKRLRIDATSQRPIVRRQLFSMAKSLSSMSATDTRWGKIIKDHPDRDPYPLLRRDFKFAEGFVKTLDILLDDSSEETNGVDAEVKAALSSETKRILHDLRETYAQITSDVNSPSHDPH